MGVFNANIQAMTVVSVTFEFTLGGGIYLDCLSLAICLWRSQRGKFDQLLM